MLNNLLKSALAFTSVLGMSSLALGVELVTATTIKTQKDLTTIRKLKNGIPVVIRTIPDSDILQLTLSFDGGLAALPKGQKSLNEWLWATVPMAGKGYPKEKVFETAEKYGLEIGCQPSIEDVTCGMGALNEYWDKGLPLFAAVMKTPEISEADAKLNKDRVQATFKNIPSDPGQYANEIVNTIFYDQNHPYRLNSDEALAELGKLKRADLVALHKKMLNAKRMRLTMVTSMSPDKVMADLEKAFGSVESRDDVADPVIGEPTFDQALSYNFNDRELPTAYIRVKMNAPGIKSNDAIAARFLYEILGEELGEEIRTRRSLSYAVHASTLQYKVGIGVITASTAHPKETLEALKDVLTHIKTKTYSKDELEEYKRGFATAYFLTLETHASLAAALDGTYQYFGNTDELYDMPKKLDAVTPADIKRLANELLVDPRVGVIFGRKEFDDEWAKTFIKAELKGAPAKKS